MIIHKMKHKTKPLLGGVNGIAYTFFSESKEETEVLNEFFFAIKKLEKDANYSGVRISVTARFPGTGKDYHSHLGILLEGIEK